MALADTLRRLLKLYGVFALAHFAAKLFIWLRHVQRCKRALGSLPGYDLDLIALQRDVLANLHRLHDFRRDSLEQFRGNDLVRTQREGPEITCLTEESVKWLLKDNVSDLTKASPRQDVLAHLLSRFIGGGGIFILRHGDVDEVKEENAQWSSQRKTASKIFTKNSFGNFMADVFTAKADRLVEVLGDKADRHERIDMQNSFFSFTMDSIQKIFFSRDVDTLSEGTSDPYALAYDGAHHNMMEFGFRNLALLTASLEILPFPFGAIGGLQDTSLLAVALRRFSESGRAFDKHVEFLHSETRRFVRETRVDPDLNKRNDLLALFLNAPGGKDLSETQLVHIILNFIIAGRDTTACTLTWLFFELTQHLDVQEKLQQEIDAKLGGRSPTLEDLDPQNMPFLNGCLYETLRLHPPVPEDPKVAAKDTSYKGRLIPKGTRVSFIPYTLNRDPKRYPEPDAFKPERWIPFVQPSDYAFPVFQAGARFCLGREMAKFEAKLLTTKLLQNFSFKLQEGEAEKISYSLMVTLSLVNSADKRSNKLWIFPERRRAAACT